MVTKSDNEIGNPYHDDEGKFTSANETGEKSSQEQEPVLGIKLKAGADLSKLSKKDEQPKIKIKEGSSLNDLFARLNDLNQCANVPKLFSATDIENHIEEYFSKQVCDKIVELYGNSPNCRSYQFRPKGNPNKVLEIFPNVLAKYRFKDNHAHYIDENEYIKLSNNSEYLKIYRGFSSTGAKATNIIDGYVNPSLDSFDLLCPNEGNAHGSNIYTSYSPSVARNYAGGYGTIIYGVLNQHNAYVLPESTLKIVQRKLNINSIENKVEQKLLSSGVDDAKSKRISHSFALALSRDVGLVAILLGADYFEAADGQMQKNILNASRWYINKDRR